MPIKKVPFVSYKIVDPNTKYVIKILSCRLNQKDQEVLKDLKEVFDVATDGTMLKIALHNYHHILHGQFSAEFIKYLFKKQRDRLSEHPELQKAQEIQNVVGANQQKVPA